MLSLPCGTSRDGAKKTPVLIFPIGETQKIVIYPWIPCGHWWTQPIPLPSDILVNRLKCVPITKMNSMKIVNRLSARMSRKQDETPTVCTASLYSQIEFPIAIFLCFYLILQVPSNAGNISPLILCDLQDMPETLLDCGFWRLWWLGKEDLEKWCIQSPSSQL